MSFPTTYEEALSRAIVASEGVFPPVETRVWDSLDSLSMSLNSNQLVDWVLKKLLIVHGNHGFTRFMEWMEFMKSIDAKWDHSKFKKVDGSYTF